MLKKCKLFFNNVGLHAIQSPSKHHCHIYECIYYKMDCMLFRVLVNTTVTYMNAFITKYRKITYQSRIVTLKQQ